MTKEELDKKIIDLNKRRQVLELQRLKYVQEENFYHSFVNMIEVDKEIREVEEEQKEYDFYHFGESYIYYILNIINCIEETNEENYYEMVDFSNQDVKSYVKEWKSYHHIVSVIARHNDIDMIKEKYFNILYRSNTSIDEYDLQLIPIVNTIDGLIVNITTSKAYSYVGDFSRPDELTFLKEVFAEKFPYIHEFLTILFNYRLQTEKKQIDTPFLLKTVKDIIEKYQKQNKVNTKK